MAGAVKYMDAVFCCDDKYYWCEYQARLQAVQIRYHIKVFNARKEEDKNKYEKDDQIADSDWKKTPRDARVQAAERAGIVLDPDQVKWYHSIPVSISVSKDF